jgi:hypothetical protein
LQEVLDRHRNAEEEMPCAYPKAFIDTGCATLHHVAKYWGAGLLKVFRGVVDMKPDDRVEADGSSIDEPFLLHG